MHTPFQIPRLPGDLCESAFSDNMQMRLYLPFVENQEYIAALLCELKSGPWEKEIGTILAVSYTHLRKNAVAFADAINSIEGVPLSPIARCLSDQWQ